MCDFHSNGSNSDDDCCGSNYGGATCAVRKTASACFRKFADAGGNPGLCNIVGVCADSKVARVCKPLREFVLLQAAAKKLVDAFAARGHAGHVRRVIELFAATAPGTSWMLWPGVPADSAADLRDFVQTMMLFATDFNARTAAIEDGERSYAHKRAQLDGDVAQCGGVERDARQAASKKLDLAGLTEQQIAEKKAAARLARRTMLGEAAAATARAVDAQKQFAVAGRAEYDAAVETARREFGAKWPAAAGSSEDCAFDKNLAQFEGVIRVASDVAYGFDKTFFAFLTEHSHECLATMAAKTAVRDGKREGYAKMLAALLMLGNEEQRRAMFAADVPRIAVHLHHIRDLFVELGQYPTFSASAAAADGLVAWVVRGRHGSAAAAAAQLQRAETLLRQLPTTTGATSAVARFVLDRARATGLALVPAMQLVLSLMEQNRNPLFLAAPMQAFHNATTQKLRRIIDSRTAGVLRKDVDTAFAKMVGCIPLLEADNKDSLMELLSAVSDLANAATVLAADTTARTDSFADDLRAKLEKHAAAPNTRARSVLVDVYLRVLHLVRPLGGQSLAEKFAGAPLQAPAVAGAHVRFCDALVRLSAADDGAAAAHRTLVLSAKKDPRDTFCTQICLHTDPELMRRKIEEEERHAAEHARVHKLRLAAQDELAAAKKGFGAARKTLALAIRTRINVVKALRAAEDFLYNALCRYAGNCCGGKVSVELSKTVSSGLLASCQAAKEQHGSHFVAEKWAASCVLGDFLGGPADGVLRASLQTAASDSNDDDFVFVKSSGGVCADSDDETDRKDADASAPDDAANGIASANDTCVDSLNRLYALRAFNVLDDSNQVALIAEALRIPHKLLPAVHKKHPAVLRVCLAFESSLWVVSNLVAMRSAGLLDEPACTAAILARLRDTEGLRKSGVTIDKLAGALLVYTAAMKSCGGAGSMRDAAAQEEEHAQQLSDAHALLASEDGGAEKLVAQYSLDTTGSAVIANAPAELKKDVVSEQLEESLLSAVLHGSTDTATVLAAMPEAVRTCLDNVVVVINASSSQGLDGPLSVSALQHALLCAKALLTKFPHALLLVRDQDAFHEFHLAQMSVLELLSLTPRRFAMRLERRVVRGRDSRRAQLDPLEITRDPGVLLARFLSATNRGVVVQLDTADANRKAVCAEEAVQACNLAGAFLHIRSSVDTLPENALFPDTVRVRMAAGYVATVQQAIGTFFAAHAEPTVLVYSPQPSTAEVVHEADEEAPPGEPSHVSTDDDDLPDLEEDEEDEEDEDSGNTDCSALR